MEGKRKGKRKGGILMARRTYEISKPITTLNFDFISPEMLPAVEETIKEKRIAFYWPCHVIPGTETGKEEGIPYAVYQIKRHRIKNWVHVRCSLDLKEDIIIDEGFFINLEILSLEKIPAQAIKDGKIPGITLGPSNQLISREEEEKEGRRRNPNV
jgi:hypothetical protein